MTPYKIKKEYYLSRSCLVDPGRMLLFMVEYVFLPMGRCKYIMQSWGREEAKGQKIFMLNFYCLEIKYKLYFTVENVICL